MDGFTAQSALSDPVNDPVGLRSLGYYDESDLPFYYGLARAYAISDRHFASVLGPTYPNRLYYFAGTSFGVVSDVLPPYDDALGNPYPNLFLELDAAGIEWRFYGQDNPSILLLLPTYLQDQAKVVAFAQFAVDAAAGTLPAVSFVEGSDSQGGSSPDEDPPADPQVGQQMVAGIVDALTHSPQWPTSALILSYDEQGGFYDHVLPPAACVPDDLAPQIEAGGDPSWQFDQLGLRVPLIAVSPFAKRGYVSHQVTDHASVLRLLEAKFNLPAMTRRDANAEPPFDLFDFSHANLDAPALPDAGIDPDKLSECKLAYPPQANTRK
jgi:phospholipase C